MELREYAATIWKWLWLILLAAVVAGVASWFVVKDQPAVYQTSTTLMIGQAIQQANPDYSDFYTSEQLAQTYSELIQREPVLKTTAAALGFEEEWRRLKGQVAVSLVPGTQLLEIRVTDTDPVRAKAISDELARQLIVTVEKARPKDDNRAFIQEQAATLPPKIEAAQNEIRELEAELGTAFSARQIQDIQNRITTLEGQINNWQATFAQFQLLLGDAGSNVMSVIEEAPLPVSPIGSSWLLQVALAAAIGGMLAVGAGFLIEYLDDTVRTTEEMEGISGLPALGVIAQIPGERPADKLVVALHPKNPISEAYRSLRTGLRYASPDRPIKSLMVSSPHAKEGKSTVLANLAVAMAQAGESVVVVDSDLRRPTLHRLFQAQNTVGLTTALLDDDLFMNGCLQETGIENLRVMTSGPLPPNPSELLGSQRMKRLMEDLAAEADVVLYDTPPVLPVTDAVVLAGRTDAVLLVSEAGRTRKGALQRALDQLRQVGAPLVGLALNRVARRGRKGYYYYYYYYSMDEQGRKVKRRKRPRGRGRKAQAAEQARPPELAVQETGGVEAGPQEMAPLGAAPPDMAAQDTAPAGWGPGGPDPLGVAVAAAATLETAPPDAAPPDKAPQDMTGLGLGPRDAALLEMNSGDSPAEGAAPRDLTPQKMAAEDLPPQDAALDAGPLRSASQDVVPEGSAPVDARPQPVAEEDEGSPGVASQTEKKRWLKGPGDDPTAAQEDEKTEVEDARRLRKRRRYEPPAWLHDDAAWIDHD